MRYETKYRLMIWKYYFDKGFGLTNNLKYIIGLIALYEVVNLNNFKVTITLGVVWTSLSILIGWWWYRKDWNSIELEIENKVNPFVKEMRKRFK